MTESMNWERKGESKALKEGNVRQEGEDLGKKPEECQGKV